MFSTPRRVRRIQALRAFRRPKLRDLEDWRLQGMEDWGKGKSGLENGCLGAGKSVSGYPKWVLGLPNWRQNGSLAVRIGAWRVPGPPKLDLGRFGRRCGGLRARLNGHLGGPRDGLDAILGPLGRPRRRFGSDFGGFRGHWKSMKMRSSGCRNRCEMAQGHRTCILEAKNAVLGPILASQNLPKWNLGGLQGPRGSLGNRNGSPDVPISSVFGPPR